MIRKLSLLCAGALIGASAMAGTIETATFDEARMRAAAETGHPTATDLADWLVREADVPFRQAHHVTGRAVRLADERGVRLWELPLDALRGVDGRLPDLARADLPACRFAERCPQAEARCRMQPPVAQRQGTAHRVHCWVQAPRTGRSQAELPLADAREDRGGDARVMKMGSK